MPCTRDFQPHKKESSMYVYVYIHIHIIRLNINIFDLQRTIHCNGFQHCYSTVFYYMIIMAQERPMTSTMTIISTRISDYNNNKP